MQLRFTIRTFLFFCSSIVIATAEETIAPMVPGFHQKHPLTEAQQGAVLMSELRCASCHEGMDGGNMKAAPDLREAGSRLTFEALQKFIANPATAHHGSTMPQMMAGETEEKRREVSTAISHYLLSISRPALKPEPLVDESHDGFQFFHTIGCVACHPPRDQAGKEIAPEGYMSLSHVAEKYQPQALAAFLFEPLKVRPSGRMPDMNLSKYEAEALASYLTAAKTHQPPPATDAALAAAGKKHFTTYHCTSCHQVEADAKPPLPVGPAIAKLNPDQGCLSPHPQRAPHFSLNDAQRKAIRAALAAKDQPVSEQDRIKMRLTQLNCIACHTRDDYGGVAASRDAFFHSKEEALGNEARIPPPLTMVGAKLRTEWLNRLLYDRERSRPYMNTRMPHYGDTALEGLVAWLDNVDRMEPLVIPEPDNDKRKQLTEGGLQLLGDKGLNCIACHNYNGTEAAGMKGIDLMSSYQRLTPEWFFAYMKNPASFRPGIIMPSYWPEGKALQTEILKGDTNLQLEAIWYTFSLGRSARDPSGLRQADSKLVVADKAVLHRGRSQVGGYRGIAVGLPGGWNYAFNANNGSLGAVWKGEFISVNWKSQGAGDFQPAGKHVPLPQDVAFLPQAQAPDLWPLLPKTSKEAPVNPDPTYPREWKYAFGGYECDAMDIPTFRYRSGDVSISDRLAPGGAASSQTLKRTLTFTTDKESKLVFRALTGEIESPKPQVFQTKQIQLVLSHTNAIVRPSADQQQELIVLLTLPKGSTTLTIDYILTP
jgi:mono/diheme cytochrome c family protein